MQITVITSTIGRPELKQCIESVQAQTYPHIKHMVFVNGPKYGNKAAHILSQYRRVNAIYLPEETGDYGMGGSMADVFAAAPFLTNSDFIFYLDDDNFYAPNHVESVMDMIVGNNLEWAYSLRKLVSPSGDFIADDNWCSLGHYPIISTTDYLVDNSCFAVSRKLATRYGLAWTARPFVSDRCFCMALKESGARCGCTGLYTVNYRIGTGSCPNNPDIFLKNDETLRRAFPDGFPWGTPRVYGSSKGI